MKHRKNLWNTVAVLIVAVLVIMAFTRGDLQFWLYVAAFTAWGIWASIKHLIPYLKECHYRNEVKREEKYIELSSIGVDPTNKCKGVGSLLIDELKKTVDFDKFAYITLETDAVNNDGAIHFYEKNG